MSIPGSSLTRPARQLSSRYDVGKHVLASHIVLYHVTTYHTSLTSYRNVSPHTTLVSYRIVPYHPISVYVFSIYLHPWPYVHSFYICMRRDIHTKVCLFCLFVGDIVFSESQAPLPFSCCMEYVVRFPFWRRFFYPLTTSWISTSACVRIQSKKFRR